MSYLRSFIPTHPCGCIVGDSFTVAGIGMNGHGPTCRSFEPPRTYTWREGTEAHTGDLLALAAHLRAARPDAFPPAGTRDHVVVDVTAGDGARQAVIKRLEGFGDESARGWRVRVDTEFVDVGE